MTTVRISKEIEFDAGHRVPNHVSKCRNPHGHRYRVRATIEGDIIEDPTSSEHGMLTDFGVLKQLLVNHVHDPWDHAMLVHAGDTVLRAALEPYGWKVVVLDLVPTAENLARIIFDVVGEGLDPVPGLRLVEVAVWETPTSVAYVTADPLPPVTFVSGYIGNTQGAWPMVPQVSGEGYTAGGSAQPAEPVTPGDSLYALDPSDRALAGDPLNPARWTPEGLTSQRARFPNPIEMLRRSLRSEAPS